MGILEGSQRKLFLYTQNFDIYKNKLSTFKTVLIKSFSKILLDFTESGMIC